MSSFALERSAISEREGLGSTGDAMLVAAAQSGDAISFVELSRRHSKRILLVIYRITNNWQDAEDVLQESLMRAFGHIHTFEYKASFSTWFTSIAMNTALMLLRKEKRSPRLSIDSCIDDRAESERWEFRDHRENPEQYYVRQQKKELLRRAMLRLPPEWRRVVELQQSSDFSIKEIARSLGISESAVKSRLFRAKSVLTASVQRKIRRRHSQVM